MKITSEAIPFLTSLMEVAGKGPLAKTRPSGLAVYDPVKGLAALSPDFQTLLQLDNETVPGIQADSRVAIPLDLVLTAFKNGASRVVVKTRRGKMVVESFREGVKKVDSKRTVDDPGLPRIFVRRAGGGDPIRSIGRVSFEAVLRGSSLADKDYRHWTGGVRLDVSPAGIMATSSNQIVIRRDGRWSDGSSVTVSKGAAERGARTALSLMGSEDVIDVTMPEGGQDILFQGDGWKLWMRVSRNAFREAVLRELPEPGVGAPIPRDELLDTLTWASSLCGQVAWFPGGRIVAADGALSRAVQGPAIDGVGHGAAFRSDSVVSALKEWSGNMVRVSLRLGHSISFECPDEGVVTALVTNPSPEQVLVNSGG